MSLSMFGSVSLAPFSLAIAGATIDLGAVSAMFAVAGAIVVAASLAGIAWGVPAAWSSTSLDHPGDRAGRRLDLCVARGQSHLPPNQHLASTAGARATTRPPA